MQGTEEEVKCSLYFMSNQQYRQAFIFFALKCELVIRSQLSGLVHKLRLKKTCVNHYEKVSMDHWEC